MNILISVSILLGSANARPVFGVSITDAPSIVRIERPSFANTSQWLGNQSINDRHTYVSDWYNTTGENISSPEWAKQQETFGHIITWVVVAIVATWIIMTLFWCFWGAQGLWARARTALRGGGAAHRDIPLRELQLPRRARQSHAGPSTVTSEWPRASASAR
ncbi:hypothetical protein V8F20_001540 [Naviculisporaceae sp. PSN 640]